MKHLSWSHLGYLKGVGIFLSQSLLAQLNSLTHSLNPEKKY